MSICAPLRCRIKIWPSILHEKESAFPYTFRFLMRQREGEATVTEIKAIYKGNEVWQIKDLNANTETITEH